MVTNYPRPVATRGGLRTTDRRERSGGLDRTLQRVRTVLCGLRGHDALLHFERERMALRCVSCGHETPGWELNEAPPTITVRGDARRHALHRPRLIATRRVA
jgi:hypothetical protein